MTPLTMLLSEGATEVSVTTALATAKEIFNWVLGVVLGNAMLTAAFCLAVLVPVGVMAFKKITKSV